MSSSTNNGSLRPGWYNKGAGGGGGRGFQPPPTVSDRGDKSRSASVGSAGDSRRDSNVNKFAALLDDDDVIASGGGSVGANETAAGSGGNTTTSSSTSNPPGSPKAAGNSRSEAFRSSFNRSSSTGERRTGGRSLADLAASVPEAGSGRRNPALYEAGKGGGGERAGGGPGRFTGLRPSEPVAAAAAAAAAPLGGFIDSYKPDPKVIRYTRERLLSLRPPPNGENAGPPESVKALEGSVVVSTTPQDPVCWDTFDAEEIWETVRKLGERRASAALQKPVGVGPAVVMGGESHRRDAPPGRWQRGVALPQNRGPPKDREADNPDELWDDPVGGATGAAADFSSFGALPGDDKAVDVTFDFDKMAEASRKLEEEIHGPRDDSLEVNQSKKMVDVSRPLASAGTTLVSGSGDNVNVFEDFDAPGEQSPDGAETSASSSDGPTAGSREEEGPSASSRLMKMIGVSKDPSINGSDDPPSGANPWGTATTNETVKSGANVDPILGVMSIPLNPWGGPAPTQGGMDIGLNLGAFTNDQKRPETEMAVEREKRAQQEVEMRRRRQEEEARRVAIEQQKAQERARQQQAAARQQQQQQQPTTQQTQIELVLMERICVILENSWGQSDLVSILSTLHSEDSRVIPLLGNADALRALIARSPQRIELRREPGFGGDMAVLLMTNSQWQQKQQAQVRLQQEQLQRRQQEEAAARAHAQNRPANSINFDAPWFYSDPQNNVQGPFGGEEMRQWLEAGYFKGDLPISQVSSGPFHPLSVWFTDLKFAFRSNANDKRVEQQAAAEAAERERQRKASEEAAARERRAAAEAEARRAAQAQAQKEAAEKEAAVREFERQQRERSESSQDGENGGNESSTQLKMMLGLPAGATGKDGGRSNENAKPITTDTAASDRADSKRSSKAAKKGPQAAAEAPAAKPPTEPAPPPAAPAWGGVSHNQPRKSMSEIQQEEARRAAIMAAKRGGAPQPSSGWANVAAGKSSWSGGNARQSAAAAAAAPAMRPEQARQQAQTMAQTAGNRKVAPVTQQQHQRVSSTAEEFGTSMSPALEKWCKEKMLQINGSDDTTLVGFCMTLNDANEIRQYLTTYLGSTSLVNSFATEFINKRGLGNKREEWETPGSAKKVRKKKGSGKN